MKNINRILAILPECYLIILVFLYGYTPPISINPIAIGLLLILILQMIFKNRVAGIIIATLLILVNLFMLFAGIAEFNEFSTFNDGAKQLLFVGLSLFIVNLAASAVMIVKYGQNRGNLLA